MTPGHRHSRSPDAPAEEPPRIVVSLGTDHHPFPRLVAWVDTALERLPGVTCLLQNGATEPSSRTINTSRLPHRELLAFYRSADAVVVQGGPGSILDARLTGHVPLAVPRRAELGEVVDNHQVAFTRRMVQEGDARLIEGPDELSAALREILARPSDFRTAPRVPRPELATRALGEILAYPDPRWRWSVLLRRSRQVARDVRGPRVGGGA